MPKTVDIREAKTRLSRLVDEAAAGTEVIIAKAGKPMARLSPLTSPVKKKRLGLLKGRIRIAGDFNEPLPDEALASFEGSQPCGSRGTRTCSSGPWDPARTPSTACSSHRRGSSG